MLVLAGCPSAPPAAPSAPVPSAAPASPAPSAEADDRSCLHLCAGKPRCLRIEDTVSFATKSKALGTDAQPALERIARWLEETPEVRQIEVRGYAHDGAGRGELLLASARATNASQWLVAHGVAAKRVVARGFANAPPDPPHVESGVEITVIEPDQAGCCAAPCL